MHLLNFQLGSHDGQRISSKYGSERIDLLNILIKTLPGIAVTYYVTIIRFFYQFKNLISQLLSKLS